MRRYKMMTFKETALALGLLESDEEWDACLAEATSFMPKQLHSLFITILIFGEPSQPQMLWEKYKDAMAEDLSLGQTSKNLAENECLLLLKDELEATGRCLGDCQLPKPNECQRILKIPRVIQEEMFDEDIQRVISEKKIQCLNTDQRKAFDTIMTALQKEMSTQRIFFLNAPGGYGKTFLIETLLSHCVQHGKNSISCSIFRNCS